MKTIKNILLIILFFYFSGFSDRSFLSESNSSTRNIPKEMQVNEDITYVVKFGFIKLGEVRLVILEKKDNKGQAFFKSKAYIDSYGGIPFVSIHQIYESNFTSDQYSTYFRATEKEKNYIKFTEYFFKYEKNRLEVKKGKFNPYQMWTDSTTKITKKFQDGLSLFYFARLNTGQIKTVNIPCFVTEKFETTVINFYNNIEKIEIDAVDYDIACVKLDGYTTFKSIYGLTGEFEGWFTNDKYAVPTIARMKVYIGSVALELKKWKKQDWKPPKYS
ncbi:MAG: DUF3108 domain-containing protein [Ignavibacteriales bacterium]|nr:DUF3108 domain-containing protein [Ignavibacteriales bacterium]